MTGPWRRDFDTARDPYAARNALGITSTGGGGSFQPLDATLTALAAYNTNGLLTQTAPDTFTGRTIIGPAAGVTVNNGNGVAGNPTLALANDLAALEALSGTNTIYYRSGTDAWTAITIGTGLTFSSGTLAASTTATASVPQEGKLTWVSATALKFAPCNGNKIKINGTIYTIPNAGIAGIANTGVFVNGTGASNLAASTVYWVFAFDNSGTVTADFCTAATHAPSTTAGNEGVEILTGNDTRTLIGLIRTNASSQFVDTPAQRFVRSWFNSCPVQLASASYNGATTTSTTVVELNASNSRIEYVLWNGEAIFIVNSGSYRNSTTGQWIASSIGAGAAAMSGTEALSFTPTGGSSQPYSCSYAVTSGGDQYSFAMPVGFVSANTGTWSGLVGGNCQMYGILGGR